jgi:hypothetical protein
MPSNKKGFYSFHLPKDEEIRGIFLASKNFDLLWKIQGQNRKFKTYSAVDKETMGQSNILRPILPDSPFKPRD